MLKVDAKVMAKLLGTTTAAVRQRMCRQGVRLRQCDVERVLLFLLAEMAKSGKTGEG